MVGDAQGLQGRQRRAAGRARHLYPADQLPHRAPRHGTPAHHANALPHDRMIAHLADSLSDVWSRLDLPRVGAPPLRPVPSSACRRSRCPSPAAEANVAPGGMCRRPHICARASPHWRARPPSTASWPARAWKRRSAPAPLCPISTGASQAPMPPPFQGWMRPAGPRCARISVSSSMPATASMAPRIMT